MKLIILWMMSGLLTLSMATTAIAQSDRANNDYLNSCAQLFQSKNKNVTEQQAVAYCQCNDKQTAILREKMVSEPNITKEKMQQMMKDSVSMCMKKAGIK